MHRIGWLLIGLSVILLLTHGGFGFFFFPLLFLPLLWMLFFGMFRGRRGAYGYGWAGPGRGCADHGPRDERDATLPATKTEERSYTGETTQLQ